MVERLSLCLLFLIITFLFAQTALAEQAGSIRGMVYDKDFEAPLAATQVSITETGEKITTTDGGNYVFSQVEPGTYTLVFSKDGYARQVKANVVVSAGQMTEVNIWLVGEFTEMEEFVVQDVQIGTGTEAALLDLRIESPSLMDSVSSELMSQAGAGDAASALKLISGTTVQDGKYAVVRGLPDRYVNSQINGVRLPTADADKRAVQLDQFPSAIIESIQVSKTFTPDQQGDASGGAVNIILKGIPDERVLKLESGISFNTQVTGNDKFLTYKGGGLNFLGKKNEREFGAIAPQDPINIRESGPPADIKYGFTYGDKFQINEYIKIGGLLSLFHDTDSSYSANGIDDKYWVEKPGQPMVPQYSKGGFAANNPNWNPGDPSGSALITEDYFNTSMFDVIKSSRQVQWGTLAALGLEVDESKLSFIYMHTTTTEDQVRLAENIRGKAAYFPDYNPDDPYHPGNADSEGRGVSPYLRSQTLTYTERTTDTMQLSGSHKLTFAPEMRFGNFIKFLTPEFDWKISRNSAGMYEQKDMFNSRWTAAYYVPGSAGWPPWIPPTPAYIADPSYKQFIDGANINYGNSFKITKKIEEVSDQIAVNWKLPFEQWTGDQGYFKFGLFKEATVRRFNQDSYGNKQHGAINYTGSWEDDWAKKYFEQGYMTFDQANLKELHIDMDYIGRQNITAGYFMTDLPLTSYFKIIGGYRYERTRLSIRTMPEKDVEWIVLRRPDGGFTNSNELDKANIDFMQLDVLPSIGFVWDVSKQWTVRGSYTETVARQTFKELSAAPQQEYLGGDVFIGNPQLQMSALKNYDLRLDYKPYPGGLVSFSFFKKDIINPIEYVQGITDFSFTTPVNYPKGKILGYELEVRQQLGRLFESLEGFTLGGNATFIESEVTLPEEEKKHFEDMGFPMPTRNMMNAPEHLYNIFLIYDFKEKTQFSLFYTIRGDTLVTGAGQSTGKFLPNVYETEFGTLNMGVSHKISDIWTMKFQAQNLLNPNIESVYRAPNLSDVVKTSYRKGMDFSLSLSAQF